MREKRSLEAVIEEWKRLTWLDLKARVEKMASKVYEVMEARAKETPTTKEFLDWLGKEAVADLESVLEPFIQSGILEPGVASRLVGSFLRRLLTRETDPARPEVDFKLVALVQAIAERNLSLFETRLDKAIDALQTSYKGPKVQLAIDYSEIDLDLVLDVLRNGYIGLIAHLQIILPERGKSVNRSDWEGFQIGTTVIDPQNPGKTLEEIDKKGFGQEVAYALTTNIIRADFLGDRRNAIRAPIGQIPDEKEQRIKKAAYRAAVLLLFRLAELEPEERRKVLENDIAFRTFLERDKNLSFLTNGFGITRDGTIGLLISGFIADIAAIEVMERAA